jgi:DNA-binding transcriptional regulator of glucitol operon
MKAIKVVLATVLVALPAAGFAQTTQWERDHINQRKVDQQGRIAQGVKNGQLAAGETAKLEHQEQGINREERGMRAEDNGHLTGQDRRTLARQQNVESARIYRDKHNGNVQ